MPIPIPIPGFKWFHVFCAWSVLLLGHAPSSQESSNARLRSQVAQIPQYFLSTSSFLVGNDGEREFFLGFHNASRKASKIPWWEMNMSVSILRNSARGNFFPLGKVGCFFPPKSCDGSGWLFYSYAKTPLFLCRCMSQSLSGGALKTRHISRNLREW